VEWSDHATDRVNIIKSIIEGFISDLQEGSRSLSQIFEQIGESVRSSSSYWIGEGGDHTRTTFQSKIAPLNDEVLQLINQLVQTLEEQLRAAIAFDQNTYVE
jgi:uncharacterized protein YukE